MPILFDWSFKSNTLLYKVVDRKVLELLYFVVRKTINIITNIPITLLVIAHQRRCSFESVYITKAKVNQCYYQRIWPLWNQQLTTSYDKTTTKVKNKNSKKTTILNLSSYYIGSMKASIPIISYKDESKKLNCFT